MTTEEILLDKFRGLPPEKRQKALDLIKALEAGTPRKRPLRSVEGLWAGMGVTITDEDIAQARREMWGNFPREEV